VKAAAPARIRSYQPSDLDDLYRICRLTADNGGDATPLHDDPQMPGHLYAAPYGVLEPSLAFVAEDDMGVGGYVLGALDTHAFEERLESQWYPRLRERYPDPATTSPGQEWTPDQRNAYQIHHPWRVPAELTAGYPSHLHIDLLPRLQGSGTGGAMMRTLLAALGAQGSPGVHLHVSKANERAIGFYRHLGFAEVFATKEGITFGLDIPPPG
jgi:ribosomal protein S18 acetylase RimI-like enzyme